MSAAIGPSTRYKTLDIWRGVACLVVVVYHSVFTYQIDPETLSTADRWIREFASRMWIGVPMFFVISGYCIAATAESNLRHERGWFDYVRRRLRRIYPPAWFVLIGAAVLVAVIDVVIAPGSLSGGGHFLRPWWYDLSQWFGNLTLTEFWRYHVWGNDQQALYLGHYWTLCYEEQFYAVMGLIMLCAPNRQFLGAGIVTVACFAAAVALPSAGWAINGFFFDGHWLLFAMGILAFQCLNFGSSTHRGLAVLGLAVVGIVAVMYQNPLADFEKFYVQELPIAALFAILLILTRRWDQAVSSNRWLLPLALAGQMCFSLYLVHLPVIQFVRAGFAIGGMPMQNMPSIVTILICGTISIVVAWPFYWFVERRFLNSPSESIRGEAKAVNAEVGELAPS
jgi:peptidoglycan/LPS O-acetylase OafA/YrhL